METNANDTAFPADRARDNSGLTIREYFAAQIMAAQCTSTNNGLMLSGGSYIKDDARHLAGMAVVAADALISALNEK